MRDSSEKSSYPWFLWTDHYLPSIYRHFSRLLSSNISSSSSILDRRRMDVFDPLVFPLSIDKATHHTSLFTRMLCKAGRPVNMIIFFFFSSVECLVSIEGWMALSAPTLPVIHLSMEIRYSIDGIPFLLIVSRRLCPLTRTTSHVHRNT